MKSTCSIRGCSAPPVGRSLCSAHYQRAKRAGCLDEVAPPPPVPCKQCGGPIPSGRRWGAIFCSAGCKEAAACARQSAGRAEEKAGRQCERCGNPLGAEKPRGTRFCSKSCGYFWHNGQRSQAALIAKANRDPCANCGNPVPVTRVSNAIYCSPACGRKARGARWRAKASSYNRLYKYGITAEQFDALMASQDGKCAICGTGTWKGRGSSPHVDHDHATGRVRGILCGGCNNGLGNFADDPARLRAAADYLERAISCTT